jgi:anti-sigma-K factor RskA
MTTHDAFDDAPAAYALGALDVEDRLAFEAHLPSCARCQDELAGYRRVVAAIGAGVEPIAVPDALKARTLARAAGDRSQPAAGRRQSGPDVRAPARQPRWTWLQAAAVLVMALLGAYAVSLRSDVNLLRQLAAEASSRAEDLRSELNALRQETAHIGSTMAVLSAPDLVHVDLRGTNAGITATARAYLSPTRGLVFTASRLAPLTSGRVYQLWVIPPGGGKPVSAGVVPVDASGEAAVAVETPPGVGQVGTVAVTDEPGPQGSAGPTSAPLLAGSAGG